MNEDYLWDKSGQPDPEIQRLEEILGTLRYQPKRLAVPTNLVIPRRRRYFPLLAIAATVLLALLAAGIWFRVRVSHTSQPRQANVAPAPTPIQEKTPSREAIVEDLTPASPAIRNNKPRKRSTVLKQHDREEALAAKEQLLFALRLASEKLNLAQRKTQGTLPATQIKNQHRVG